MFSFSQEVAHVANLTNGMQMNSMYDFYNKYGLKSCGKENSLGVNGRWIHQYDDVLKVIQFASFEKKIMSKKNVIEKFFFTACNCHDLTMF